MKQKEKKEIKTEEKFEHDKFVDNYRKLVDSFYTKKIENRKFGELIWHNLINFLKALDERITKLEEQKK